MFKASRLFAEVKRCLARLYLDEGLRTRWGEFICFSAFTLEKNYYYFDFRYIFLRGKLKKMPKIKRRTI